MPLSNIAEIPVMAVNKIVTVIFLCLYAVDIFFWIGGFFLGFILSEQRKID
jgi:hypothetical protein